MYRIFMGPYRKVVWGDAFVCQSVWSDNEDYMLLYNKPCDEISLEALAKKIF